MPFGATKLESCIRSVNSYKLFCCTKCAHLCVPLLLFVWLLLVVDLGLGSNTIIKQKKKNKKEENREMDSIIGSSEGISFVDKCVGVTFSWANRRGENIMPKARDETHRVQKTKR